MVDDGLAQDHDLLPEDPEEMLLGAVSFGALSATGFEEFCFDLMSEAGFVNVDWRIAWATAERPDVVLFIASGFFTNGAKDWIATFRATKPPFRLRTWEMPQLRRLLIDRMDLAFRHEVETSALRRVSEIMAIEQELFARLWYGRSEAAVSDERPESYSSEVWRTARAAARRTEEQYGVELLSKDSESPFDWGMLSGKISAIRWVLGADWDFLDS